jgi:hypothetical protein
VKPRTHPEGIGAEEESKQGAGLLGHDNSPDRHREGDGDGELAAQAFLTAGSVSVSFQCQNHGQNFAPGHPATSNSVTGPVEDIAPHNGQITFNVSLPAPVPSAADVCPNKQRTVVVFHVDYNDVVLHIQQNGVDLLTDGPERLLHQPVDARRRERRGPGFLAPPRPRVIPSNEAGRITRDGSW